MKKFCLLISLAILLCFSLSCQNQKAVTASENLRAQTNEPFFLNFSFWAVIIAALAVIFSQLPPIPMILRRTRLNVIPLHRLQVFHWLGNPNINLHILLTNEGGREIRVLAIKMQISRENGDNFVLPGQTFSPPDGSKGTFLLTQFSLKPKEDWSNFVNFFSSFTFDEERHSKQLIKDLKKNIQDKLANRQPEEELASRYVEGDSQLVAPVIGFFETHFKWQPGEYTLDLQIDCQQKKASVKRQFRFTLYESDYAEFKEQTEKYKYGLGVYFPDPDTPNVYVNIKELV